MRATFSILGNLVRILECAMSLPLGTSNDQHNKLAWSSSMPTNTATLYINRGSQLFGTLHTDYQKSHGKHNKERICKTSHGFSDPIVLCKICFPFWVAFSLGRGYAEYSAEVFDPEDSISCYHGTAMSDPASLVNSCHRHCTNIKGSEACSASEAGNLQHKEA